MTSRTLYRIAAALTLLFALGHTASYPWSDPRWGVDMAAMKSSRFQILGFSRTYWDFYVGNGLFVSVFLLLAAVLAWQLGGLPAPARASLRATAWALTLCFAAFTALSAMYLFGIPLGFCALITLFLAAATLRSAKPV